MEIRKWLTRFIVSSLAIISILFPTAIRANSSDVRTAIQVVNESELQVSVENISSTDIHNVKLDLSVPSYQIKDSIPSKDTLAPGEVYQFNVKIAPSAASRRTSNVLPKTGELVTAYVVLGLFLLFLALLLLKTKSGKKHTIWLLLLFGSGILTWSGSLIYARQFQNEFTHHIHLAGKDREAKLVVQYEKAGRNNTVTSTSQTSASSSVEATQASSSSSTETQPSSSSVTETQPSSSSVTETQPSSSSVTETQPSSSSSTETQTSPSSSTETQPSSSSMTETQTSTSSTETSASSQTEETSPSSSQAPQPKVTVSGYAYNVQKQALGLKEIVIYQGTEEIDRVTTEEEDGYFYLHLVEGRNYQLKADGFDVSITPKADNHHVIENKVGEFSLGKHILDERTTVAFQPDVVYIEDFIDYSISNGNQVHIQKDYNLEVGDKIVLPPNASNLSGAAFRVVSVNNGEGSTTITVEQITDLSEVLTEFNYTDNIENEAIDFEPSQAFQLDASDSTERSFEKSFEKSGTVDLGDGLSVKVNLAFKIRPEININFLFPLSSKILLGSETTATVSGTLSKNNKTKVKYPATTNSSVPSKTIHKNIRLGKISYTTHIGAVITGEVYLYSEISTSGTVTVSVGLVHNGLIGYDNKNFRFENQIKPIVRIDEVSANLEATAGIELTPGLAFLGFDILQVRNKLGYEIGLDLQWKQDLVANQASLLAKGKGNPYYQAILELPWLKPINEDWGKKDFGRIALPPENSFELRLETQDLPASEESKPSKSESTSSTETKPTETPSNPVSTETTEAPPANPESPAEANPESDFEWEEIENGVRITKYMGENKLVIIPASLGGKPVIKIGSSALRARGIRSVQFPASLQTIDSSAFQVNNLTQLTLPPSLIEIGAEAFGYNPLTNLVIPDSVTHIGHSAFASNQLQTLQLGNSVTEIDGDAFAGNLLKELVLPDSLQTLGDGAFRSNRLHSLQLPNYLKTIPNHAFQDNQLTSLYLPDAVTSIEQYAFAFNKLSKVRFSNNLISIDPGGFEYNQLTHISLPQSVKDISSIAFKRNPLVEVQLPEYLRERISDGSYFNSNNPPQLVFVP
ncbi:leucine-rich repeat domain-containing protein [Streptococcus suis]|uniref:leucine-rich repeat domain-containing protein n=1 Tax=Streptococcus suis TaxID=1307 RepID=UPI000CF57C1F|nr:leucine-rich repeat domain-containing protein [Streptococcus suis]